MAKNAVKVPITEESTTLVVEKKKRGRKHQYKPQQSKLKNQKERRNLDSYKNLDVTKQTIVIKEENIIPAHQRVVN